MTPKAWHQNPIITGGHCLRISLLILLILHSKESITSIGESLPSYPRSTLHIPGACARVVEEAPLAFPST